MLYEEDMFHPLNPESQIMDNSIVKKFMVSTTKKGFYSLKRKVNNNRVNVDVYASGGLGTNIRNAISGEYYYGYKVGTIKEDLFYKTSVSTSETGNESVLLFFENPEQYERHFYTQVDAAQIRKQSQSRIYDPYSQSKLAIRSMYQSEGSTNLHWENPGAHSAP